MHWMILIHNVEAKNHTTQSGAHHFSAELTVHYAAYTMAICQHWQVKAVNDVRRSAIFDQKGNNDGYFSYVN